MEKAALKILLADDDEDDRLLFKDAFNELKIKSIVNTVNNGKQLMGYLAKNNADLPHLIFLDLNMPYKNGLECLKEIRSSKKFNEISIAIYSTSASEHDIGETFRNGANLYMKKPSDFSILKQLLAKVISAGDLYRGGSLNREDFLLRI